MHRDVPKFKFNQMKSPPLLRRLRHRIGHPQHALSHLRPIFVVCVFLLFDSKTKVFKTSYSSASSSNNSSLLRLSSFWPLQRLVAIGPSRRGSLDTRASIVVSASYFLIPTNRACRSKVLLLCRIFGVHTFQRNNF